MENIKIGIVEDDLLIAESIMIALRQIGYSYCNKPARNYAEAVEMIKNESPDLLIVDIMLDSGKDGIDLAAYINEEHGIPFIFLTASSDERTIQRAKEVTPYGYLIKPFTEHDLFSTIEIAYSNYIRETKVNNQNIDYLNSVIFIKERDLLHKVEIGDIIFIQSDNVYLNIYTAKRHYVARARLDDFVNDYAKGLFVRVHRSYAINPKYLESINFMNVKVADKIVPMHKNYKRELLSVIKALA